MNNDSLSHTIARALFRCSESPEEMQGIENDLALAAKLAASDVHLEVFFNHPKIRLEEKKKLLSSIFLHGLTKRLVDILLYRKDLKLVIHIYRDFQLMVKERSGTVDAEIKLPWEPAKEELELLIKTLEKTTGKKVKINLKIAPEILGGAWVKIGDKVFDNTVRRELARIKGRSSVQ
jgi:F-type H+-transporting ATPase subunit delta